jgi:UDP-N-acetylglucosamine diphosphorylase/glucosamine-1-phosphate N-acetyltransferase
MQICLFEDSSYRNFYPISLTRPVFVLRCGMLPLYQRINRWFSADILSFAMRNDIAPLVAETLPSIPVNIIKHNGQSVLFLNGRLRNPGNLLGLLKETKFVTVLKSGSETIGVWFPTGVVADLPSVITPDAYADYVTRHKDSVLEVETTATLYNYLWDFVNDIDAEVIADFAYVKPATGKGNATVHPGAYILNESQVHLGDGVEMFPTSIIDAAKGPVYIGANVRIEPHSAIVGPCYIGDDTIVLAGKIVGSSIGSTCRVGGEIEESIFHGYVNKYHAGFIGHSVVGSWVNFGAMTTNSDLKNNYSAIRVSVNGSMVDTGSIKVGSFIGDHTKFGIGTLLNTGISIGIACNLFGGVLVTDKEIKSFSWGPVKDWKRFDIEKAIETAALTMGRRKKTLSEREISLLRTIFNKTESETGVLAW